MAESETLTKNQALVLERLEAANSPLSAYELLDQLREEGIKAPLQIYRALEKLQAADLVHRLESLNSFVACAEPHCHAHEGLVAFAICENCGDVTEFVDAIVQSRLAEWSNKRDFVPSKTSLEIRGVCAKCA